MKILSVSAHKILASLGNETIEATIEFSDGSQSTASVPAGISAGKYEKPKVDTTTALVQIAQMAKMLSGRDWTQESLDWEIGKMTFSTNATLAVSAAFFKATLPTLHPDKFPKLFLLLFEGGKHGNSNLTVQEFCLVEDSLTQAKVDFTKLKDFLQNNNIETLVGAEGAFSPPDFDNAKAIATLKELFPGQPIALDVAGSFNSDSPELTGIFSVEDPYDDESWDQFALLTAQNKLLVVGDDLTVTNPDRIKKAIEARAISAVVIKPNQIGTISASLEAVRIAKSGGLKIVVSHRGEDTNDTWIVDFALAAQADFVKFGGLDRGERIAKYNRLKELGMK